MSAGGSKLAVFSAIGVNAAVTVAKLGGFVFSGSGSMLAEGIHSAADCGNQTLLAVGMARSNKAPDEKHPMGYGREAFVWAMISAVGIFFIGCGATVTHGVQALLHPEAHEEGGGIANLVILGFSLVAEGASFATAMYGMRMDAKKEGLTLWQYLRKTDDPFGVAVVLEDTAAVLGVVIALAAVALSHFTHQPWWDALGSILVGLLLGLVAFFLIRKNRHYLIGAAIRKEDQTRLQQLLLNDPAVEAVVVSQSVVEGTTTYRISAEIDFDGRHLARSYLEGKDLVALQQEVDAPDKLKSFLESYTEQMMQKLGSEVDRLEAKIRSEIPKADQIGLEPD